jgi:hypothetical protein
MRDLVQGTVGGVVLTVDALRVLVWTDERVIGRLQARRGDGLAPGSRRAHLRGLRALGLATLFLPWLALGMVWGARTVELAQGPLWASRLLALAGWLLAWAYGPGVLQWFRMPAWALAVYRQCGLDPRRQMPWLRRPRLWGSTPLDRRWRLARMWAGATALSLMGWGFVLWKLPAGFANDGLGLLVIALLWMLGIVQGYTNRIGEVIELGSDRAD